MRNIKQTANMRNFFATMQEIEQGINDGRPNIGVISGKFGRGKSVALSTYCANKADISMYWRALQSWTSTGLLEILARSLDISKGRSSTMTRGVAQKLSHDPKILIIDEVNIITTINRDKRLIELLRDIHDESFFSPIVFIGTDEIIAPLKENKSLWDRVRVQMEFKDIGVDDIRLFCEDIDVNINDDVLRFLAGKRMSLRLMQWHLDRINEAALSNGIKDVDMRTYNSMGIRSKDDTKR